jgi:tetratricopeptide (TPR) repeat protein
MIGTFERFVGLAIVVGTAWGASVAAAADDPAPKQETQKPSLVRDPLLADEVPPDFVPVHPRTADDREKLELVRLYTSARALEDRGERNRAITLLEEALKKDPESVAILKRLSNLCMVTGKGQQGMNYARKVLDLDPEDTATLGRLVDYYERNNNRGGPAAAEALLQNVVNNPRLKKESAAYLLVQRDLGDLYAEKLIQPEKAADAYAKLVDGLDTKVGTSLSLADQKRILGDDEAEAYARFGDVFFRSRRYELAIRAFRRGLVYSPDDAQLPQYLAQALLKGGKADEALTALEPFLKRQPQGREPYELLVEILTGLKRQNEILPRIEAAAKADPKNNPLQYFLADRYREGGQPEKAEALYKTLVASQPDPHGFGALSATLLREKKYAELLKVLGEALGKRDPQTLEAVKPQIESIANNAAEIDKVFEVALKVQEEAPPGLSRETRQILSYIATKSKKTDKLIPIERLVLKQDPNPQAYRELFEDLYRNGKYDDAVSVIQEMFTKFPVEKTPQRVVALAKAQMMAGKNDEAIESARDALKTDPNELDALLLIGFVQSKTGKNDDAIATYKGMLEKFPDNDEIVQRARSGLSVVYTNMERFDDAEKELEILLEKNPEEPGVNNDLGYLYADRGKNLEKAEAMIRKALDEEPDSSAYLDSLGWVLFKRGKVKEAVEPLEKASKGTETDATIHDHLGDVYFKLKQLDKAKAAWEQAEKIGAKATPPDKRVPEIRKKLESLKSLPAPDTDKP